jgi:hypothetical protein
MVLKKLPLIEKFSAKKKSAKPIQKNKLVLTGTKKHTTTNNPATIPYL